jgi:hypothetical protein
VVANKEAVMPCTISREEARWYERENNKKLTGRDLDDKALAIAVACAACKGLVNLGRIQDMPGWVQKWWAEHVRKDEEAARERQREARKKQLAAQAKSKLSKEEREALGL